MQVSVVIPVYNAAKHVRHAVQSALAQSETDQVLLIDDGSEDSSLQICRTLEKEDRRIRLLRHDEGGNRGAAASRNLGIKHARCDLVAFLDADDFYLSGRFEAACGIMASDPTVDGVYDAVGVCFEVDKAREWWYLNRPHEALTTVIDGIPPESLFAALLTGRAGHFCTNGIVLRRSLLKQIGAFDTQLTLSEDTFVWLKCAAVGRLVPGVLDRPVAMRRLHGKNSIMQRHAKRLEQDRQMREMLWLWSRREPLSPTNMACIGEQVLCDRVSGLGECSGVSWRLRALAIVLGLGIEAGRAAFALPLRRRIVDVVQRATRLPA